MAPRTIRLVVEAVFADTGVVFARLRDPGEPNFRVANESVLARAPLEPGLTMPRALRPDGSPRFDLFAFQLSTSRDARRFSVGAEVELTPSTTT